MDNEEMMIDHLKNMVESLWQKMEFEGEYKPTTINIEISEHDNTTRNVVYYEGFHGLLVTGIGGLNNIINSFEKQGLGIPKITVNGQDVSNNDREGIIQSVKDGKFITFK